MKVSKNREKKRLEPSKLLSHEKEEGEIRILLESNQSLAVSPVI